METLELFLHGHGEPQVVEASANEALEAVLARHDALPANGEFVYVGEAQDALSDPHSDEDAHLPADIKLPVGALQLPVLRHIHTRAVRSVEVTVNYNGQVKRRFSPAATVETVTVWAKKRLHIDDVAGAELVLELEPSKVIPRADQHLGELLQRGQHALEFNLVKEVTPQG